MPYQQALWGLRKNLPEMHIRVIRCAYNGLMETNTYPTAADFTTYKGVIINNVRNASTDSMKIMFRDIEVTYLADRWCEGGDAVRTTTSLAKAKAMIDWLLDNGATVQANRIVTTMNDFDICEFGDSTTGIIGYSKFMKAGK
jgi:hypothetical protein